MGRLRREFLDASRPSEEVHTDTLITLPHWIELQMEQLENLCQKQLLDPDLKEYVVNTVLPEYQCALDAAKHQLEAHPEQEFVHLQYQPQFSSYFKLYNRALHLHPGEPIAGGTLRPRNFEDEQQTYLQSEHRA